MRNPKALFAYQLDRDAETRNKAVADMLSVIEQRLLSRATPGGVYVYDFWEEAERCRTPLWFGWDDPVTRILLGARLSEAGWYCRWTPFTLRISDDPESLLTWRQRIRQWFRVRK